MINRQVFNKVNHIFIAMLDDDMFSLYQLQVSKQQTSTGNTVFYVGFEPSQLDGFSAGSEFTIVYAPTDYHGWEVVTYQVIEPHKAYAVLERRPLTETELRYFQSLLEKPSLEEAS